MARRIIYLIRHGNYLSTTVPPAERDGNLTDMGKIQARLAAKRISQLPVRIIHHSDTIRATETAQIIAKQFPRAIVKSDPLLRECIPSVPEKYMDVFSNIPAEILERGAEQAQVAFATYFSPDSESEDESDRHEIIVSHGNLISHFICRVMRAPLDAWMDTDIYQCGISEVIVRSQGNIKLVRHNDVGHLPLELCLWE